MKKLIKYGPLTGLVITVVLISISILEIRNRRDNTRVSDDCRVSPSGKQAEPFAYEETAKLEVTVQAGSDLESYLDELICQEWQTTALSIDVSFYIGWARDEKESFIEVCRAACKKLESIQRAFGETNPPRACRDLHEVFLDFVVALGKAYEDFAFHGDPDRSEALAEAKNLFIAYHHELERFVHPPLPEDLTNPGPSFSDKDDQNTYETAVDLMQEKKYIEGLKLLATLQNKHRKNHCIMLKISDCLVLSPEPEEDIERTEAQALELLAAITDSKRYSSVMAEAFLKWRTLHQSEYHGLSNWSSIPNHEYNGRRRELINIINECLTASPGNAWARSQKRELLNLPNISRGGLMGNSNLSYYDLLYLDNMPGEHTKNERNGPVPK